MDLKARRMQFAQTLELIRCLRREIRCDSLPLPQVLRSCKNSLPLLEVMNCAEPFDLISSYEEAKLNCMEQTLLDREAWQALDSLFYALGRGDVLAQEERLEVCESYFFHAEEEARGRIMRNGKPAIVLGSSVGAILVLMFI